MALSRSVKPTTLQPTTTCNQRFTSADSNNVQPTAQQQSILYQTNDLVSVNENYVFRTIRREDLPALKELQVELFPVKYKEDFYQSLLKIDKTYTLLAFCKQSQKLVGVCSCRIYEEQTYKSWITSFISSIVHVPTFSQSDNSQNHAQSASKKYGYIMTLGVTHDHRRRGLASAMLEILETKMQTKPYSCSRLTLHCKVDNQRALNFYSKFGFHVAGRVKDYYDFAGRYEDAFHLVRELSPDEVSPIENSSYPESEYSEDWGVCGLNVLRGFLSVVVSWLVVRFLKLNETIEDSFNIFSRFASSPEQRSSGIKRRKVRDSSQSDIINESSAMLDCSKI